MIHMHLEVFVYSNPFTLADELHKSSAAAEMGDRFATIDIVRKEGVGLLCPFPWVELGPHLTQRRVGRGLPPYQVAS